MRPELFYNDNEHFFDHVMLSKHVSDVIQRSSLISAARNGDIEATMALKIGFWPFVREFELAIDRQLLPRLPLIQEFGEGRMRQIFLGITRAVREMKKEEGSHAAHWMKDARCLGLDDLDHSCVSAVQSLIDKSYTNNIPEFFATLAGTEFIAEELARHLNGSLAFTNLFSRKRWIWGEVHLVQHQDGPSHLEIDLDLARAYSGTKDAEPIQQMVVQTIDLFGCAAEEVEAEFCPRLMAA